MPPSGSYNVWQCCDEGEVLEMSSQLQRKTTIKNKAELFVTFIEMNCVSSSYLKKKKKKRSLSPLCHHWNVTRPKLSYAPK